MRKFSVLVCFFVLLAASAIAQETKKITGKVTDGNGEVLSGVTVVEVNGKAKAVSNDQGIYTITVSGKTTTLRFNSLGFQDGDARIANRNVVDISLVRESGSLAEVVVFAVELGKHLLN